MVDISRLFHTLRDNAVSQNYLELITNGILAFWIATYHGGELAFQIRGLATCNSVSAWSRCNTMRCCILSKIILYAVWLSNFHNKFPLLPFNYVLDRNLVITQVIALHIIRYFVNKSIKLLCVLYICTYIYITYFSTIRIFCCPNKMPADNKYFLVKKVIAVFSARSIIRPFYTSKSQPADRARLHTL